MAKAKIIVLRIFVFLLVFIGIVAFIIEYPVYKLGDAGAGIIVWLDMNENGVREDDEPLLPNVCVWGGYAPSFQAAGGWQGICDRQYYLTDSDGTWGEFFPGGSCSEIYNAINPPENFFPTTPTVANGCFVEFGLSQEKPVLEVESQDAGLYFEKERRKEEIIHGVKIGGIVLLISAIAGLVSFIIVRPDKVKPA